MAYEAINRARGVRTMTVADIKDALLFLSVDGVTGRIEYSSQNRNPDTKGSVLVKFSDVGFQFVRRLAVSPIF